MSFFHLLGGVSKEQRRGRAPLAVGVVMGRGGAVAGARGGRLTYHPTRVQRVLQDGGRC